MKKISWILLLLCLGVPSFSQQVMTLDNALAIGMKNNYNILMARNQLAVNKNDEHYAFGAFLPQLNATASKVWSSNNLNASFENNRKVNVKGARSNVANLTIGLGWTLFDGLRVFASEASLKDIEEMGALRVKSQVIGTISAIMGAYYNIVQQKQQLESLDSQMAISQARVDIARNEFLSGLGSKIDLLQAEVDLNAEKAAYLQQQALIEKSKNTLNQIIVLDPAPDYDVSDSIPVDTTLTLDQFQVRVLTDNPDLLEARKNIQLSGYTLKETEGLYFPTIAFNSNLSFGKQNSQPTNPYQSLFNQSQGLNYGFSASIPIFNGFNVTRQVRDARLNQLYARLSYQNLKSQLSLSLKNAFRDYEFYIRDLKLEEQNLAVAQENVRVALAAFREGQTTTIEVKTAQQGLADAVSRLISARYNARLSETTLLQLRGDLLK